VNRLLLAALVALGGPAVAAAASPDSDAERLVDGLPKNFEEPVVVLLPLLDQRPLALDGATAELEPPPAWKAFMADLSGKANLDLVDEREAIERLRREPSYQRGLQAAQAIAYRGQGQHREVRLKEAAQTLAEAIAAFRRIGHHVVDPREVARASLTRGLALLEQGDELQAAAAFEEALMLDPGLRLRPGFDRQETIDVFERTRQQLLAEGPPPPTEAGPDRRRLAGLPSPAVVVRARVVPGRGEQPDRLEVSYRVSGGLQEDVQPLGGDPADDGSRLASRVWACLPFGKAPRAPRERRYFYLDSGFTWFTYLRAPVELFSNFGAGVSASWMFAPNFTLDARVSLTNSNRDREEDLRADVATIRGALGTGYTATWGRLRLFASVGFEAASPDEVVTTGVAACKYFEPEPGGPCAPGEIDRVGRTLHIGAAVGVGASLRLVDDLSLTLRVDGAEYFYETDDDGLGRPLGAQLGLGWRFD
jgi:tetratricopeptide (TPR) repeat protein